MTVMPDPPLPQSGTQDDFAAYVAGYDAQRANPGLQLQQNRGPFFLGGQVDAMRGRPPQIVSYGPGRGYGPTVMQEKVPAPPDNQPPPVTPTGAPPAGSRPWRPTDAQVAEYWRGYQLAKSYGATSRAGFAERDPDYYYQLGLFDGSRGVPPLWTPSAAPPAGQPTGQPPVYRTPNGRVIVNAPPPIGPVPPVVGLPPVTRRPPPFGYPVPLPGPTQAAGAPFYEVAASLFGKPVALDTVVKLQKTNGPDWFVLGVAVGTDIRVTSDKRDGFHLANPRGAFAQMVRRAIAQRRLPPDPRWLGLDGWYGAKTRNGIRVLTARDLEALNVAPDVLS